MSPSARKQQLPSVDALLKALLQQEPFTSYGRELVRTSVRQSLQGFRKQGQIPPIQDLEAAILARIEQLTTLSLRPVLNATGILLHTNLGRAPLGTKLWEAVRPIAEGYCNIEYDLATASRGRRQTHLSEPLKYLTGAESALVVNNAAAAVILVLHTLAKRKEVLISRGELIEIGGAFRLPEIMATSGAKMVEVGTTNRTRLADYHAALSDKTAAILKAHTSNFTIEGFTETVSIRQLADLAADRGLPLVLDQGSGLLSEVRSAITDGVDVVVFSGDKLFGGPQAGIIVGKKVWLDRLAKVPLLRALRPDKVTLALLAAVCRQRMQPQAFPPLPLDVLRNRSAIQRRNLAEALCTRLVEGGVSANVVASAAYCGGGSLPNEVVESFAVLLTGLAGKPLFFKLQQAELPVVGTLQKGRLLLDVAALADDEIIACADAVVAAR